jgi:hypothetical protein
MSPQSLSSLLAVLLSLLFSYVPGFSTWYDRFDATRKRLIMLAGLLLITAATFALACSPLSAEIPLGVTCTQSGAWTLVESFILALVANQSTYLISPKPTPLSIPGLILLHNYFALDAGGRIILYIQVRSWSRLKPIHRAWTPGSPSPLRPRKPPKRPIMRMASRKVGSFSGSFCV